MENPGLKIKKKMVFAAKRAGDTKGEEMLSALMKDENPEVREAASMRLLQLREERR